MRLLLRAAEDLQGGTRSSTAKTRLCSD